MICILLLSFALPGFWNHQHTGLFRVSVAGVHFSSVLCVVRCMLCCCVLLCVVVCCCVLLCAAVCCCVLLCAAVCCCVLLCAAVCYVVLCAAVCYVLLCAAVCYVVLCAMWCCVLCGALASVCFVLLCAMWCCDSVQCAAVLCSSAAVCCVCPRPRPPSRTTGACNRASARRVQTRHTAAAASRALHDRCTCSPSQRAEPRKERASCGPGSVSTLPQQQRVARFARAAQRGEVGDV